MDDDTDDFDGTDETTGFEGTDGADHEAAIRTFLSNAEDVYDEYEEGYMDADAALDLLSAHIEELQDSLD